MNRKYMAVLLCMLLAISASGLRADGNATNDIKALIMHKGIERSYLIHLPPGFGRDALHPLVIAMHGGGGTGGGFDMKLTRGTLSAASDSKGAVLVFPDGVDRRWGDGRIAKEGDSKDNDDTGFISDLIDVMIREYAIDPSRVYVTGMSNGGIMSIRLAMDIPGKIAAIAPVGAELPKSFDGRRPEIPVPAMIINGTKDPIVPYNGGTIRLFKLGRGLGEVYSMDETVRRFAGFDGCHSSAVTESVLDADKEDGISVDIRTYGGCDEGSEVVMVKVAGGGHTWPGGNQYLCPFLVGKISRDINASEMIMDFFLRHTRDESNRNPDQNKEGRGNRTINGGGNG